MDSITKLLTSRDFLIAVLAAISVAAVVFTLGAQFLVRSDMKERIKRVALERDKLRAAEMARLRNPQSGRKPRYGAARDQSRDYMKRIVERFSLQKAFVDEGTVDALARAGYRGQGHLTTYLFMRFATPLVLGALALVYFLFMMQGERPLFLNIVYAAGVGLVGAYMPILMLKDQTSKRQQSIRRAWPDCLDLMLLCVEAGMSVEHAFKRVAKEVGQQSAALAEEITLTTAETPFSRIAAAPARTLASVLALDGVRSVMTALIQADRYGTSVGQALRVMAEEGREQRMMEAEKKAASLPPKLTVPLILFFLPVLFIVIISPALIKVFSTGVHF